MRWMLFSTLLIVIALTGSAQTLIRVTDLPTDTPANATLYVAGSFNGWHPGTSAYALTREQNGVHHIVLPKALTGSIEFKITRGSWATVETDKQGGEVSNHRFTVGSEPATVEVQVANWKDRSGVVAPTCVSTALQPNVQIISEAFAMPQLVRTRRVWIYLPNDYATAPFKRYPVVYMHDGQNVFDACTSFSGEWGVDETLSQLQQQGLDATGSIVVALDNGAGERLNELSPWKNPEYGGGQGRQYVDFMVQTLKPYIDANYRTLTGREFTGIAGSSMGGLISVYAALRYPQVYSKVGAFPPAFWFAKDSLFQYLRQHQPPSDTRFYFVSGTTESETMAPLMQAIHDSLSRFGTPSANLSFITPADGKHAEWFWRREFSAAYTWLMKPAALTGSRASRELAFSAVLSVATNRLTVQLPAGVRTANIRIQDMQGRTVLKNKVRSGEGLALGQLAKGNYLLQLRAGSALGSQLLLKE